MVVATAKKSAKSERPAALRISRKPDGRRARTETSIRTMIEVAIDIIALEGLSHLTMQRVAEKAGVSSALVVFHFKTKENLLRSIMQFLDAQYDEQWQRLVRDESIPLTQRVINCVTCAERFAHQYPRWISAWIAFFADRRSAALYRKTSLPLDYVYIAEARALYGRLAQEGGYKLDVEHFSERVHCMILGSWVWSHLNPRQRKKALLMTNALELLEQTFPNHFPIAHKG